MIFQKNILKFWGLFFLVLTVALGAITVAQRWHRIFPSQNVSDIYKRYENRDGIDVSYVKRYKVNDTVFVDVTLIEVKDTSVWNSVCEDFHITSLSKIPEEIRELYFSDHTFTCRIDKDSAFTKESGPYIKRLIVYSRKNMTVCVFHSLNDKQYDAILDKELENITY